MDEVKYFTEATRVAGGPFISKALSPPSSQVLARTTLGVLWTGVSTGAAKSERARISRWRRVARTAVNSRIRG